MTTGATAPGLVIVIGANGAGKTTWALANRGVLPKPFYNADSIADGLGDPNDPDLQQEARKIVDDAIERDLENGRSFGFESTYSGSSRPEIVRRAKNLGYNVQAVFIGTEHHDINIERVRNRVQEGGHDIPKQEIIRRWIDAQNNLLRTWACFDTISILDNSGEQPVTVLKQQRGAQQAVPAPPAWVDHLMTRRAEGIGEPDR